jgi:hypothetical protein
VWAGEKQGTKHERDRGCVGDLWWKCRELGDGFGDRRFTARKNLAYARRCQPSRLAINEVREEAGWRRGHRRSADPCPCPCSRLCWRLANRPQPDGRRCHSSIYSVDGAGRRWWKGRRPEYLQASGRPRQNSAVAGGPWRRGAPSGNGGSELTAADAGAPSRSGVLSLNGENTTCELRLPAN